jgi:hypothetical protein
MTLKDRTLPPSEKSELRDKTKAEIEAQKNTDRDRLKGVLRRIGMTDDGKFFYRWLREECGGGSPILGAVNGTMDRDATLYQAMRLNLWVKIRRMLNFDILKEIEYEPDQIS